MYSKAFLQETKFYIIVTFVAAALSSFSLSLIPYASGFEGKKSDMVSYIIAAVFWIGLLLTIIAALLTRKMVFRYRKKLVEQGRIKKNQLAGALSFSNDWRMWIVYGMIVIGLFFIVTDIIIGYVPETIMFPIVSITLLLFTVHCVIDGKYYKAYKLIKESAKDETNRKS